MEQAGKSKGLLVRVRGTVQGVGFRPAVWKLAQDCDLVGDVCNDAEGVLIRIQGASCAVQHFIRRLQSEAPALASIESVEIYRDHYGVTYQKIRYRISTSTLLGETGMAAAIVELDAIMRSLDDYIFAQTLLSQC